MYMMYIYDNLKKQVALIGHWPKDRSRSSEGGPGIDNYAGNLNVPKKFTLNYQHSKLFNKNNRAH